MAAKKKHADDATRAEILEWVGAGPKREGVWSLTEDQARQFKPGEKGIISYVPGLRYTRWNISEHGFLRWEPTCRREFERAQITR